MRDRDSKRGERANDGIARVGGQSPLSETGQSALFADENKDTGGQCHNVQQENQCSEM